MADLDEKLDEVLAPLLRSGEQLSGACVATQQSMFKGRLVVIGVTDARLILQGMNRKWEPDGEPISLPPERIASADAAGAGGGWAEVGAAIMDSAALTLKLKTTDGEKLMMMRGTGRSGAAEAARNSAVGSRCWAPGSPDRPLEAPRTGARPRG
ncbi:MAG: hypothetical protein ACRDLO_12000 [Solirubrobacterales bacterium]